MIITLRLKNLLLRDNLDIESLLQRSEYLAGFKDLCSTPQWIEVVAASETAMTAIIASDTALDSVVASDTAMTAVAASETAMTAIIASDT